MRKIEAGLEAVALSYLKGPDPSVALIKGSDELELPNGIKDRAKRVDGV